MILSVACILSLAFIHGISAACNKVRLAGSELANEGRLEVECDGNWGTVCDDKFESHAAAVACSMLGFEGGEVLGNQYGPGTGEILLDDVRCHGDEATLGACQHGVVGVSNCEHDEDVSISCTIPITPTEAPTDGGGGGGGAGDSDGTGGDGRLRQCPSGWVHIQSVNGCYKVVLDRYDWEQAGLNCQRIHPYAHLLVLDTNLEHAVIKDHMISNYDDEALSVCWQLDSGYGRAFFTAGHREAARGWVWQILKPNCPCGEKVSMLYNSSNWDSGEPSDTNTHCMSLFRGRGYNWHDYYCYVQECSICEIDLY